MDNVHGVAAMALIHQEMKNQIVEGVLAQEFVPAVTVVE